MDLNAPNLVPTKKQKKTMPKKTTKKVAKTAPVKLPALPIYTEGKSLSITGYAGGSSRTKKVSIVAFVPAGQNIFVAFATAFGFNVPNGVKNLEIRFGRAVSKDARYIVRENRVSASNPRNKIASFYSPTASTVEKQNKPATKKASATAATTSPTPVTTVSSAPPAPRNPFYPNY